VADRGAWNPDDAPEIPQTNRFPLLCGTKCKGLIDMSEEAQKARQALQESMDLREQGHSDD
jgi:hypothetical protein